MPLLDHFHPPLSRSRHWEALHSRWAAAIADALNDELLPEGYFAEAQTHAGGRVEVDVATFEEANGGEIRISASPAQTAAAVAERSWSPPRPAHVWPAVFPDHVGVAIFHEEGGPTLAAAVELASPRNEDRPEARRAFAIKCAAYLQSGVGLIVIDVVTSRQANLHNELVQLLDAPAESRFPDPAPLYAVAYRPVRTVDREEIEIWPELLAVGGELPRLPLAVNADLCVLLDLETTYVEACRRSRLDV